MNFKALVLWFLLFPLDGADFHKKAYTSSYMLRFIFKL